MSEPEHAGTERPTHSIKSVNEVYEKVWGAWGEYAEEENCESAIIPGFK